MADSTTTDDGSLAATRTETLSLAEALDRANGRADALATTLSRGLRQAIVDGKSLESVLGQIVTRMSDRALEAALTPLTEALGGLVSQVGSSIGSAVLNVAGLSPVAHADGGIAGAPALFGMADGRTGLLGEAGPEAILPLARGADGRLGVAAAGGGQGRAASVTVNVTTPDVEGFRRSQTQVAKMLARAVGRGRRGL